MVKFSQRVCYFPVVRLIGAALLMVIVSCNMRCSFPFLMYELLNPNLNPCESSGDGTVPLMLSLGLLTVSFHNPLRAFPPLHDFKEIMQHAVSLIHFSDSY